MKIVLVKSGVVTNVVKVAERSSWMPPWDVDAHVVDDKARVAVGWEWSDGPVEPPRPEPAPQEPTFEERLAAAGVDPEAFKVQILETLEQAKAPARGRV
jgi:hypothetical protein